MLESAIAFEKIIKNPRTGKRQDVTYNLLHFKNDMQKKKKYM